MTATREPSSAFDVPFSTVAWSEEDLRRRSYRTTPQALREIPGIMVQETSHGQGSPYIRGFTSQRTLFLIDGIRLNNSVFREGPNQYWNTVDPWSIEQLEVVKGPSSVLYGSDAIGGTVAAYTKSSRFRPGDPGTGQLGGSLFTRYSSAEQSIQGRLQLDGAYTWENGGFTSILLGGTAKNFGNLRGGDDVGVQEGTGYDENDLDVKVEHWFDEDLKFTFLYQQVFQNNVPRTHRTVDGITWRGLQAGTDLVHEFDQRRSLMYWQLEQTNIGSAIADEYKINVSFQQQNEVRMRTRGNGNMDRSGFEVDTFGALGQATKRWQAGRTTYGFEYYRDTVQSFNRNLSGGVPADGIQGPVADDASYDLLGIYLQHAIPIAEIAEFTLGGRFNYAEVDANKVRDPITDQRISVADSYSSLVGSARLRVDLVPDKVNLFGGVSQGFRAPNLSDLTRFDVARSNEFEVPATGLDPEIYTSYEVGFKVETDNLSLQTSYFYTTIEDQIQRFPTGNTNMAGDFEVTRANVGDGSVEGVEFGAAFRPVPQVDLYTNITWLEGRVETFDQAGGPLRGNYLTRLMPFTSQFGARWESEDRRLWIDGFVVYAAMADKLSISDRRDNQRIPPGGTPDYTTLNLRGAWAITDKVDLNVLLENITDVDYRVHGSGVNRPGRNLILGMQARF